MLYKFGTSIQIPTSSSLVEIALGFNIQASGMDDTFDTRGRGEAGHTIFPTDHDQHPSSTSTVMVPIEVYQNIFQFVGKQTLTVLSRVSEVFQHEAEYILYESADLTIGDCRSVVVSWCAAVTNTERRAHRVHTLRFPPCFPPISELPPLSPASEDSQIYKLVAQAFNAVINLKHLYFFGEGEFPVTLYPSTLKDCTFSLSSFVGQVSSFSSQDQIDFLIKHPDIEFWVPTQPFLLSVTSFPKAMVPCLRGLVLTHPALTSAFEGRPIEALVLCFIHGRHTRDFGQQAIVPLESFARTLHTLVYIHGRLAEDWSTADIINDLAGKIPNLKSLSFTPLNEGDPLPANKQQSLVDAVSRFHHLEVLLLSTEMDALRLPNDTSNPPENAATRTEPPAQSRKIATQFMTACPSLKQLCFPTSRDFDSDCLTYVRSNLDGRIRFDGFYRINTSRWWMI